MGGGDPLKEALLSRLAQKAIGFLGGPPPRLPAEMLSTFSAALFFFLLHSRTSDKALSVIEV